MTPPAAIAAAKALVEKQRKDVTQDMLVVVGIVKAGYGLPTDTTILAPRQGISNPPRRLALFLAKEYTKATVYQIGAFFQCDATEVSRIWREMGETLAVAPECVTAIKRGVNNR